MKFCMMLTSARARAHTRARAARERAAAPATTELRHTDLACGAMPEALQTMTAADAPWKARYRIPTYYNPTNLLSTLHAS